MLVCVVNESALCSSADVQRWTKAIALQCRDHVAPPWGLTPPTVLYVDALAHVPSWAPFIVLLDSPDIANALGYHTEAPNGRTYGRVFAKPSLDNHVTVSSVLSHEVVELLGDPWVNGWRQAPDGRLWALELCDPVESASYRISVDGAPVVVSDFVLPAFFDWMTGPSKKTSYAGTVGPFKVQHGGYAVVMAGGQTSQIFGDEYPEWRLATKTEASRTARREAIGA